MLPSLQESFGLACIECEIDEADVRVRDQWVSRRHCQLDLRDGVLVVRDLGSKHGTWVNHRRVEEATVLPGDELNIGVTTLRADYHA